MKAGKRTNRHKAACMKYRAMMLNENGYISCESVNCDNPNQNFPPHSVHHIMSAGSWPSHKHLHDRVNLIMLCHKCHTEFHESKRVEEYNNLLTERVLNKLFKRRSTCET